MVAMQLHPEDRIAGGIEPQEDGTADLVGEFDEIELLADLHGRDVHVGVPVEFQDHLRLAGPRGRADAVQAAYHADRLLDRAGHERLDLLWRGVLVVGLDRQGGV